MTSDQTIPKYISVSSPHFLRVFLPRVVGLQYGGIREVDIADPAVQSSLTLGAGGFVGLKLTHLVGNVSVRSGPFLTYYNL